MKIRNLFAGMAAVLSAVFVFGNAISVSAAGSGTVSSIYVDDSYSSGGSSSTGSASGSVNYSYSGEGNATLSSPLAEICWKDSSTIYFMLDLGFDSVVSSSSGTSNYSFSYMGNNYSGSFSLSPYAPNAESGTTHLTGSTTLSAVSSSGDKSPAEVFNESIQRECDEIEFIAKNGTKPDGSVVANNVINYDAGNALSGNIVKTMASVQNVTLVYTFEYQGIIFQTTITPEAAAAAVQTGSDVPWWGPCYLANNFPTVPVGVIPAA